MISIKKLVINHQNKKIVDIAFDINKTTALVGMSGSGKSLSLRAILNLLPQNLTMDIKINSPFKLQRGKTISFVPQNPFTSLSPLTKIKDHFFCDIKKTKELFELVRLKEDLLNRFPPELSGGQLQRVVIAIALSHTPKLLLLDEPTTALDSTNKAEIIHLIKSLQEKLDFYLLFVSHDIESVKNICQQIVVLKNGAVVEAAEMKEVLENPKQEYTKELINAGFAKRDFRQ